MAIDRRNSFAAIPQLDAKLEKILNDNVIFEKKIINIQEFQSDFYSEYGQYKELTVGRFDAVTADIAYLKTFEADIKNLEADNATINGKLTAQEASIENLEADNATINGKLTAQEAEITNLSGEFASFVSGEFGTLSADVADIQTLMFGSATGTTITSEFANTVVSHIGEAQIDSAMIKDLTFDKITGFDVNTTNLTIHSEDGKSQWHDNTIQISDANRVRVQIGKDASNDYSMYVWDAAGNLMFDALGLTDSGIQREIIRNDMVAADAAINGSKLDIESVFREMDGSTYTLTSNHLTYDGKSLDLTLQSMSETDKEQGQLLSSQGTQITAIQGQIASKIWQQDIDTATGEMNTKYSELEQELGGFKTTVGETYSTKAEAEVLAEAANNAQKTAENAQTDLNNAKANLANVTSRVDATEEDIAAAQKAVDDAQTAANNAQKAAVAAKSAADQAQSDLNALTKRVETAETNISQNTEQISLRATKTEVATAKDEALNESKSYTDAQIKVSADGITSSVSATYATKTENQAALSAAEAAQDEVNAISDKTRSGYIETLSGSGFVQSTKTEDGGTAEVVVYGKSVQDGTPTPEAPVEIQSVENPMIVTSKNGVAFSKEVSCKVSVPVQTGEYFGYKTLYGSTYSQIQLLDVNESYIDWWTTYPEEKERQNTYSKTISRIRLHTNNTSGMPILFRNVTQGESYVYSIIRLTDIVLRSTPDGTRDRIFKDSDGLWKVERNCAYISSYNGESITTSYYSNTGELSTGASVVYALEVPTYESLPDSIQEELNALTTYNPVTNVMVSDGVTPDVDVSFWTRDYRTKNTAEVAKTTAEQTADKFTWLVESGTSSSNFTLTDRVASLLSSEFQIDALTTFKNSAMGGTSTVIDGGAIKANTISADKLNVTDLSALGATIGGFTIGDTAIYNGTDSLAGADNSVYLGLDGISCGTKFSVDKAGMLTANDASITGNTNITGNLITNGNVLICSENMKEDPYSGYIEFLTSSININGGQTLSLRATRGVDIGGVLTVSDGISGDLTVTGQIISTGRHTLANNTSVSFLNSSGTRVRGIALGNTDNILIGGDTATAGMYGYITAENNIVFYAGTSHDQCFASIYSEGKRYFQSKPIYDCTTSSGTEVRVNSNGTLYRYSSSSMRYKEEITCQLSEELNPERLYDLNVWQYKYREGHLDKGDQRYGKTHIGLIAEDVKQHYPIAANFNEDGDVEDWSERYLIPPMLKLIQMQHEEIEAIKAELKEIRKTA